MNSANSISLNAFEFYMFHYAFYITKQDNANCYNLNSSNTENANALYFMLLEKYFEVFIPIPTESALNSTKVNGFNSNESSSIWKSLSSTTSTFWNRTSNKEEEIPKNSFTFSQNSFSKRFAAERNDSCLNNSASKFFINSKILELNKFQQNFVSNSEPNTDIGTVLYKCDVVLNIFAEIWLNNHSTSRQHDTNVNYLKNYSNSFSCTVDHMRVVRIFVKHLHYFANSCQKKSYEINSNFHTQYNSGGIIGSTINDPLDDLKRNLWSSKNQFQLKLYKFLRQSFDQWPNDSSFRVPLETWLSYIQPWRYVSKNSSSDKNEDQNVPLDLSDWKRFVVDNLCFYTIILRQVIGRMLKIVDFKSNSLLVYRVTKVFAQDNLRDWIKEAEMGLLNGSDLTLRHNRTNTSFHLLSPSLREQLTNSPRGNFDSLLGLILISLFFVSLFQAFVYGDGTFHRIRFNLFPFISR